MGWRVRQQTRVLYPMWKNARLASILWDELFVNLNSTVRSQRGLDQNRMFAGVGISVNPRARIEIGYMNQFMHGATRDRMNHILSGVVSLSF